MDFEIVLEANEGIDPFDLGHLQPRLKERKSAVLPSGKMYVVFIEIVVVSGFLLGKSGTSAAGVYTLPSHERLSKRADQVTFEFAGFSETVTLREAISGLDSAREHALELFEDFADQNHPVLIDLRRARNA